MEPRLEFKQFFSFYYYEAGDTDEGPSNTLVQNWLKEVQAEGGRVEIVECHQTQTAYHNGIAVCISIFYKIHYLGNE